MLQYDKRNRFDCFIFFSFSHNQSCRPFHSVGKFNGINPLIRNGFNRVVISDYP